MGQILHKKTELQNCIKDVLNELEQADNFFVKKLGEKKTRYCLVLKRTLSPNDSPSVRVETIHGLAHGKFYPNE